MYELGYDHVLTEKCSTRVSIDWWLVKDGIGVVWSVLKHGNHELASLPCQNLLR